MWLVAFATTQFIDFHNTEPMGCHKQIRKNLFKKSFVAGHVRFCEPSS